MSIGKVIPNEKYLVFVLIEKDTLPVGSHPNLISDRVQGTPAPACRQAGMVYSSADLTR